VEKLTEDDAAATGVITEQTLKDQAAALAYDTAALNRLLKAAAVPLATARRAVSQLAGSPLTRNRRIMRELARAHNAQSPDIRVLTPDGAYDEWRCFIQGPEGTPYANRWWYLFVTFPETYPDTPPVFRFVTVPFHINISDEGRPCIDTLGKHYVSASAVIDLIGNIRGLLLLPNPENPIDAAKMKLYNDDRAEFNRRVLASTSAAKATVEEFTAGVQVSDATPAGFAMPADEATPLHFCSPITGEPIPERERVVASSGVIYRRSELIHLLRASSTPRCVSTGKPLTDDPATFE
jgi:ubiquitin-protein ligase